MCKCVCVCVGRATPTTNCSTHRTPISMYSAINRSARHSGPLFVHWPSPASHTANTERYIYLKYIRTIQRTPFNGQTERVDTRLSEPLRSAEGDRNDKRTTMNSNALVRVAFGEHGVTMCKATFCWCCCCCESACVRARELSCIVPNMCMLSVSV